MCSLINIQCHDILTNEIKINIPEKQAKTKKHTIYKRNKNS